MFKRNNFRLGEKFKALQLPIQLQIPRQMKTRDNKLRRRGFRSQAPQAKKIKGLRQQNEELVQREGLKVRLGEKQLGTIKVVKKDSKGNPILDSAGNPVVEEVPFDFGKLQDFLKENLQTDIAQIQNLATMLKSEIGDLKTNREALAVLLVQNLDRENLESISDDQISEISRSAQELKVQDDPVASGIAGLVDGRFVTRTSWLIESNSGAIITYLVAKSQEVEGLNPARPVFGVSGSAITLGTLKQNLERDRNPQVLDLLTRTMFRSLADARSASGLGVERIGDVVSTEQGVLPVGTEFVS